MRALNGGEHLKKARKSSGCYREAGAVHDKATVNPENPLELDSTGKSDGERRW